MTEKKTEKASSTPKAADDLTEQQTAALQLVTITPGPRTADELANAYAGVREANLWPEQSAEQVKRHLTELVEKKLLVEGDQAPDGSPTLELADSGD